jgi:hypothetical protein
VFIWWLIGVAQLFLREARSSDDSDRAVFADPENWTPADLPMEFHSITRQTTLDEVFRMIGPCTRLTPTGLVRYDLPSGSVVVLFPDVPFKNTSVIKGVQLYRAEQN